MIVLALGDGREEHYTYPGDGRFHVTTEGKSSERSFFDPGPSYDEIDYRRIAIVAVPIDPAELVREYRSSSGESLTLPPPVNREAVLEIGILGHAATPSVVDLLGQDGATLGLFRGPRSDTTIVFRYTL